MKLKHENQLQKLCLLSNNISSRSEFYRIARKFTKNISFSNEEGNGGNRCVNVYKNLLRDIRIFYTEEFKQFVKSIDLDPKDRIIKESLTPLLTREFVKNNLDD